jgi:hypothetical protein
VISLIILSKYVAKKSPNNVENLSVEILPKSHEHNQKHSTEPIFVEAQFHQDYLDVITSFGNISSGNRQIFNVNNIPCKVTHNIDIVDVGKIVEQFIEELNNDIEKNVPLMHTPNSGWDEFMPDRTVESGWDKVQHALGLPSSLFNKPVMNSHVDLVQFSDVVKYETESEIKYKCKIIISKQKVHDKLVIQCEFVLPKGMTNNATHVIPESINILGFLTIHGMGVDRVPMDNLYNFDSLEQNNMLDGKTISKELMNKFSLRQKVMQERVDNMDIDTQEKYYETPSLAEYNSYKNTQTIFDDMFHEKKFE